MAEAKNSNLSCNKSFTIFAILKVKHLSNSTENEQYYYK